MPKQFFGYIRVSTAKQGEKGVSLQEQQAAIHNYAQRYGLELTQWFEERESAAKRGRPVFARMLKLLRQGKGQGVIIHKIDRSARNLKDWADLGELIDAGVEVHFANESLDLNTRGGRLSADIQAVVAADYIRNLREEAKKGFYGRLKQGLYPIAAPLGYLDRGKGKPKEPDLVMGPLVAKAFELYSTGRYSLHRLVEEMHCLGIRNRRGGSVSLNGMSTLLNNPFYIGVIRIKKTGELFQGSHLPLISKSTFDRVQRILRGKTVDRASQHNFVFRRMVRCAGCNYSLIGELQKGHVYYRCHTLSCPTKTIRGESVEDAVVRALRPLQLDSEEIDYYRSWVEQARLNENAQRKQQLANCRLRMDSMRTRLNRLTDAFIDGAIEKALFEDRKRSLLMEEREVRDITASLESGNGTALKRLEKFLELAKSATVAYQAADPHEKRDLVRTLTSNIAAEGKNVVVALKPAAQLLANRAGTSNGGPYRDVPRTLNLLLERLVECFSKQAEN